MSEPRTMTTYRRADGELIAGEYSFTTETDWFDTDIDPTELIKEVWVIADQCTVIVPDPNICTFDVDDDDWCESKDGIAWVKVGDDWQPRCTAHMGSD